MVDYCSDAEEEEKKIPVPKKVLEDKFRRHYQVYPAEMIESYLNDDEADFPKLLDPEAIRKRQEEFEVSPQPSSGRSGSVKNVDREENRPKDRFEMSGVQNTIEPENNQVTILQDECILESYRSQIIE